MTIVLPRLSAIASQHDALICDVWGVVHDGHKAHDGAVEALRHFARRHGPVILLTNAPRLPGDVEKILTRFGAPPDCYDAIVTSGSLARDELARRSSGNPLAMLHIGPARDSGVYDGLNVYAADADKAEIVLCTGLYDDETETPENYRARLEDLKVKGLTMLCANPDLVVQRGGKLIHCAGGVAKLYESMGGEVLTFGKPHPAIYRTVLDEAARIAGRPVERPLAIGDGADTDIKGANTMGIDALFVADGIHAAELGALTLTRLAQFFAVPGVHARYAMRALVW